MLTIGSLFSGIGGLELGLERSGLGPVLWQVERSEFCRDVLAKHWPDVVRFCDVREVGAHNLEPVDVIVGGFPCQDTSTAGAGAGLSGKRSGLWFEFARIVDECQPCAVVVENVASGASRWIGPVCESLASLGYEALPIPLSAQDVGAPHIRRRVFVVAYSEREPLRHWSERRSGGRSRGVQGQGQGELMDKGEPWRSAWPPTGEAFADLCRGDDGLSDRVDRLQALGNSVVPQCAEVVGWVVRELIDAVSS